MSDIRQAQLPRDLEPVRRLWLEYLDWGNDELEARYGFRLPVHDAVEHDVATIGKFQPPDGRLLLAFEGERAVGIACLKRLRPETAEIKRMYVEPGDRGRGVGAALLQALLREALSVGYRVVLLDSPEFMTAAHRLYRAAGFSDVDPYPESEIPDEHRSHWVFMGRRLPEDD